MIIGDVIRIIY